MARHWWNTEIHPGKNKQYEAVQPELPKSNSSPIAAVIMTLIVIGVVVWYQQGQQAKAALAAQRVVDYNACAAKVDAQFPNSIAWYGEFAPSALTAKESMISDCRTTYSQ